MPDSPVYWIREAFMGTTETDIRYDRFTVEEIRRLNSIATQELNIPGFDFSISIESAINSSVNGNKDTLLTFLGAYVGDPFSQTKIPLIEETLFAPLDEMPGYLASENTMTYQADGNTLTKIIAIWRLEIEK